MINLAKIFTSYRLTSRERVYSSLGLIILTIVGISAVIGYGLTPLFTGKPWYIITPGLHLVSVASGTLLVWLGLRNAIMRGGGMLDASLRSYWPYRLIRWVLFKSFGIVWCVITIIFFAWIEESPSSSPNARSQRDRSADDIWDNHPKHYYDKEPPKPFS